MITSAATPAPAISLRHPLAVTLLSLTFTTGLVDAVSYLGLGHVFTANMTGNVVLLGFGLAGTGHLPVLAPIVSLAAFLIGAGAASRAAFASAAAATARLPVAMAVEAALVGLAALLAASARVNPGTVAAYSTIAVLGLAMGVRNATVRKVALPDLTTTVLTMTLTGLATESRLAGGHGTGTARRLAASGALFAGALVGALMTRLGPAPALALAAGAVAFSAAAYAGRDYVPTVANRRLAPR